MKLKEDLVKRLREGECTLLADHSKPEQMDKVLREAFPEDGESFYKINPKCKYYYANDQKKEIWTMCNTAYIGEIIPLADFFESDMGELEGFPEEIINAMLDEQERQGNKRDIEVFKKGLYDGFVWEDSDENHNFWKSVIRDKNFQTYFDKYPKGEMSHVNDAVTYCNGGSEFKTIANSIAEMLEIKDKKYGNSANKPLNIFAKHFSYGSRIDEKLARVKNSEELRKNDVADIIGGLILECKQRGWLDFKDQID